MNSLGSREETDSTLRGVFRWQISGTGDGIAGGIEKHGEWPAAATAAAGGLLVDDQAGHVDFVHIRSFFAIDFDADEMFVHVVSNFFAAEDFTFHDVAPVAAAVADGEEHGFVLFAGCFEGFRAPWVPLDGVVGVHEQVGAGFAGKSICGCCGGGSGGCVGRLFVSAEHVQQECGGGDKAGRGEAAIERSAEIVL